MQAVGLMLLIRINYYYNKYNIHMSLEYLNFLVTNDVIIPISSTPLNTKSKRQHNNTNLAMKNE